METWLLEHHGTNIIYEPPLSTMSLKLPSMSIFTYCPPVLDLSEPLPQELKGSPGAVLGRLLLPRNPLWDEGLGKSRTQLLVGLANTLPDNLDKLVPREASNSREVGLEKKREKFISGVSS